MVTPTGGVWGSAGPDGAALIYSFDGAAVALARPVEAGRSLTWIAQDDVVEAQAPTDAARLTPPAALTGRPLALWIAPAP